jgi:hypothetical protein
MRYVTYVMCKYLYDRPVLRNLIRQMVGWKMGWRVGGGTD